MSYANVAAAAADPAFQGRCLVAVWKAANDLLNESPGTQQRRDWAKEVLRDRARLTPRQAAVLALQNTTIAANPAGATDGDIQFAINSAIETLLEIG